MNSPSPYLYSFEPGGESTAAKVCRMVGFEKDVLELGCAYGSMTRVLVEHYKCRVVGVEYDAESAESSRAYCRELYVADIEEPAWLSLLGESCFDVIVAADILEHLANPGQCLAKAIRFLRPGGYFVLSIPNVAYNGVVAELLSEDFRYRRVGLLDDTHRRFFGYEGVQRLLEGAGLKATIIEPTRVPTEKSEFSKPWDALPSWLRDLLAQRSLGDVYQFVLAAARLEDVRKDSKQAKLQIGGGIVDTQVTGPLEALRKAHVDLHRLSGEKADLEARYVEALRQRDAATQFSEALASSRSWRFTRPFRFLGRLLRSGLQPDDADKLFDFLRSGYRKAPVPLLIRRRVSGPLGRLLSRTLRRDLMHWNPPDSAIRLGAAVPGKRDYFVFGIIDWHFRHQRPQQMALQIAAHQNRVFYISVNFVDSRVPGFVVEPLNQAGRLFSLRLYLKGAPTVYDAPPGAEQVEQLRAGVGLLVGWAGESARIAMVQHPYWLNVAEALPNSRLVYDCMDHHEGFGGVTPAMVAQERALLGASDVTLTTSSWIDAAVSGKTRRSVVVRNAADFDHFARKPAQIHKDNEGRRIIGYYGAIAEWFDIELVASVAAALPECSIVLIGADTVGARHRLVRYRNISFLGEIAYGELPRYAHAFDVCMLPFKVVPLTLATNPVKVYEYLSMGKPVVSVDLPEVRAIGGLCRVASSTEAFVQAVRDSLHEQTPQEIKARQDYAQTQTWSHRAQALVNAVEAVDDEPQVSVIVVTYNNLDLTKQCLASIDALSGYARLEVIVVDNASADGSADWLRDWATRSPNRRLILNDQNLGFAAANNQGLRAAQGEYLVMLNNDTHVTPGWVRTMVNHMRRDPSLGLLGPVTNNIGNEARIDISYENMSQMVERAGDYTRRHMGQLFKLRTAAFFCVMLRRETFERIGPLDEAFGRGFFEDDDYCRRIEQAGLRVACAEDVFIHHHLSASFNKLKHQERRKLFEQNREIYERKWGPWVPHSYRDAGARND